eukprot:jgi/Psemu1/42816/gm1.42816_g
MLKGRQAKKRRLEALNEIEKLFLASLLPMVSSGYIGVHELGRLAQMKKATNAAVIENQAIWAWVYGQMVQAYKMIHFIPKQILDNKEHKTPSTYLPLPNPSNDENSLVVFGDLSHNRDHRKTHPRALHDLDFDHGSCSGCIGLEKPPWTERLSLQDSAQANPGYFSVIKTPMESMQVSYDFYSEHERWDHHNNHGVTVAHILSELHCPDDSEETTTRMTTARRALG